MKPFTSKHCTPINYGSPLGLNEKQQRIADRGRKKIDKIQAKYEQETGGTDAINENSSKKAKRLDAREQRVKERYTKKIRAAG